MFLILQALHRAEQHLLLVTQERSIYRAEVDESKCQVQRHFVEGGTFKRYESIAGKMLVIASALTQLHHHMNPWSPFSRHAQAASNLTISSLLSVCWFAICSVAVCTCGGYIAKALLIDFCLCLLKVVSAALCTCTWWGFVLDVVLTARAYSALLSKWCFSTSSFRGDVKLSVREYVILLLVILLKRYFKKQTKYMDIHA